jgi:ribonuclease D
LSGEVPLAGAVLDAPAVGTLPWIPVRVPLFHYQSPMVPPPEGAGEPPANLIASQSAFDQLIARISGRPLVAVDTEAASFHRYHDRVYLVQVSTRELTAVIDPLAVKDLSGLGRLLADPGTEIVLHDADYDLRILDRDYGFHATRLFDTRVAAQLLNEPGIGLAALLEKYFAVRLDKKFQRADWSRRPLSEGMLAYAAADTRHLPALRDRLRASLEERGRWPWAEEEFGLLERLRWTVPGTVEEGYRRLKGAARLRGKTLTVLRELYAWRDQVAREMDRALFRVVTNEALLAMAQAAPTSMEALRAIGGVSPDLTSRRGDQILAAVQRGLVAAPEKPAPVTRDRTPHDPEAAARLERLKEIRNRLATEVDLAPGLLCPNATLEQIAQRNPKSREELAATPGLKRWQLEVTGEEFLRALRGGTARG